MAIRLTEIWPIAEPQTYKLHFARWNGENPNVRVACEIVVEGGDLKPFLFAEVNLGLRVEVKPDNVGCKARLQKSQ